jgi:hypothetical protein
VEAITWKWDRSSFTDVVVVLLSIVATIHPYVIKMMSAIKQLARGRHLYPTPNAPVFRPME